MAMPPEVQKLVENLFDGLAALNLTIPASAPAEPKPSEVLSMGVRPARADEEQAMVNIRLGYSADATRRLWSPGDIAGRLKTWSQVKDKYLAIGLQPNLAEYHYLKGDAEFLAVESFNDLSGYLSNYVGLTLHDELLADITQTGKPSAGRT